MCLQEGLKVTPLRWDADGAAGAPSGPLHGSSSRLEQNRHQTRGCPGEGLSVSGPGSGAGLCMHVFRTIWAEKAPKVRRNHLSDQGGAERAGPPGEHGGRSGR